MFGMQSIVPPSSDIKDIKGVVEFIQYVATSKGLKDALDELDEERVKLEAAAAENDAQKKENAKSLKYIEQKTSEVEAKLISAQTIEDQANAVLEDAQKKQRDAEDLQRVLRQQKSDFDADMKVTIKEYSDKNIEITAREQKVIEDEKTTQALMDEAQSIMDKMSAAIPSSMKK